jgi:hypothetical protein
MERLSGRVLSTLSWYSAAGSEVETTLAPARVRIVEPTFHADRITHAASADPSRSRTATAPA